MNYRQKKKQIKIKNQRLIERYPFLRPDVKNYDFSYTLFDFMPKGWKKSFGYLMLEELRKTLIKQNCLYDYHIFDIKEKYGELRWYSNGSEEIEKIEDKYQYISQYICINCGHPEVPMTNLFGWFSPMCETCYNKEKGTSTRSYKEAIVRESICIPDTYTAFTEYNLKETREKIKEQWYER